jgi:hypothetical protein
MPPTRPSTPVTFLSRFAVRLTCWLACSAVVPYAVYRHEQGAGTGTVAEEDPTPRVAAVIAAYDGEDAARAGGAIVGYTAQSVAPGRYAAHPVIPFRGRFRGFIYESLDGAPVGNPIILASVHWAAGGDPFTGDSIGAGISGSADEQGVDLSAQPGRLGNHEPTPHPSGGWYLLAGIVCLMFLPTQAPRHGRRKVSQAAETMEAVEMKQLPAPVDAVEVAEALAALDTEEAAEPEEAVLS